MRYNLLELNDKGKDRILFNWFLIDLKSWSENECITSKTLLLTLYIQLHYLTTILNTVYCSNNPMRPWMYLDKVSLKSRTFPIYSHWKESVNSCNVNFLRYTLFKIGFPANEKFVDSILRKLLCCTHFYRLLFLYIALVYY